MGSASINDVRWRHSPARRVLRKTINSKQRTVDLSRTLFVAVADMDDLDYASRVNTSPFFTGSRAPSGSPQPWELHDVDFLLPGTMTDCPYFHDSVRRYCASLHESDIAFPPELEDTTKPLAFRPGMSWQDAALVEPTTSEFSMYLDDDVFSSVVSKTPRSTIFASTLQLPARLRVNATADFSASPVLKKEPSAVSPCMVDKKILVTDNDLRLFSAGSSSVSNMRALSGRKPVVKKSPRHDKAVKAMSGTMEPAAIPPQHLKRHASVGSNIADQHGRPLKRTKSVDQSTWSAPSMNPRWYCVRTEGFHGMQPRLLSTMSLPTFTVSPIFRTAQLQALQFEQTQNSNKLLQSQYSSSTRKIGIYSPAERRERLKRFHEKRKLRVYHKRIKYDCRKRLANSCPRVKGRFVRKSASPVTSESASSTEDCVL